jgi:hypothetical protein
LKFNLPRTSGLGYPQVIAPLFDVPHFTYEFQKKSFISLGSRPRTVAFKRKLLPVKLFSYKTMNFYIKKMYVIKHNLTIYFACEMNKMDSLVCVVIQPWISLFRFSAPDWDCCTKCSYFTCLIQVSHITFETYRGLKSLNTTTSS